MTLIYVRIKRFIPSQLTIFKEQTVDWYIKYEHGNI